MKIALLFIAICAGSLFAQTTPAPAPEKPAAPPAPASPVPEDEKAFSGSVDVGYRWVGTGGSFNTYRSVVDLGSGVKLLGAEFAILGSKQRLYDRIDVRANNWGDDPYSTLHISARKAKRYDFQGDYRNIAYYNNLPAFANPLLGTGASLNEQALDTRKRIGSWHLELLPGSRILPFLEYEHNSDNGTGVATFVANSNEYPVPTLIRDAQQNYRGGVRVELSRVHMKIEQGGTTFKDDQQLTQGAGAPKFGNSATPIFGQTLDLTSLYQIYGVRGHSIYTDASFSANPVSWADIYGNFLYSQPVSDVSFRAVDTGNQVVLSQLLFYTGEQNLISSTARQPHTMANIGMEVRPFTRLRLISSWFTDRLHTAGTATGQDTLTTPSGLVQLRSLLSSRLVTNSNKAEANVFFDLSRKLTLRGGYRYVWGDANDVVLPFSGLTGFEAGKVRRNVAIAGATLRPTQKTSINVDFENGSSGSSYFRTSLYNYQNARIRGRYQILQSLSVTASASVLNNQNPSPQINYDFLAHQESLAVLYVPHGGKMWDFEGSYTRSTLRSDIGYLDPAFLSSQRSFYRDNSHTITALFDVNLPGWMGYKSKLAGGGSALLSSGSNPTTFYQPTAKVTVGLRKELAWVSEWRYYGFDEAFYLYQSFRAQMFTTGVRITR